jgi:hypothetical protein
MPTFFKGLHNSVMGMSLQDFVKAKSNTLSCLIPHIFFSVSSIRQNIISIIKWPALNSSCSSASFSLHYFPPPPKKKQGKKKENNVNIISCKALYEVFQNFHYNQT